MPFHCLIQKINTFNHRQPPLATTAQLPPTAGLPPEVGGNERMWEEKKAVSYSLEKPPFGLLLQHELKNEYTNK